MCIEDFQCANVFLKILTLQIYEFYNLLCSFQNKEYVPCRVMRTENEFWRLLCTEYALSRLLCTENLLFRVLYSARLCVQKSNSADFWIKNMYSADFCVQKMDRNYISRLLNRKCTHLFLKKKYISCIKLDCPKMHFFSTALVTFWSKPLKHLRELCFYQLP